MNTPTAKAPAPRQTNPAVKSEITILLLQQNVNNLIESLAFSEQSLLEEKQINAELQKEIAALRASSTSTDDGKTSSKPA